MGASQVAGVISINVQFGGQGLALGQKQSPRKI